MSAKGNSQKDDVKFTHLTFPHDENYQDIVVDLFERVKGLKSSEFYKTKFPFIRTIRNVCHAACVFSDVDRAHEYAKLYPIYDLAHRHPASKKALKVRMTKIDIPYWRQCRLVAAKISPIIDIDIKTREMALLTLLMIKDMDDEVLCNMLSMTPMMMGDKLATPMKSNTVLKPISGGRA